MIPSIKKMIDSKDYNGIEQVLSQNPALANEGLPYDEVNTTKAHPLHRICDGVMNGNYTDDEAIKMAILFLKHGANINGYELLEKQDTPLIAASSLHADKVALYYIDQGAELNHAGCHGGTALHWAAWCGRPAVVKKLISKQAVLNKKCIDFNATPLFWAVHGLKQGDKKNIDGHLECIYALVKAGADTTIPNADGHTAYDLLDEGDEKIKELLI